MSYTDLPAEIRATAEQRLTRKQLDVFKLSCNGLTPHAISRMLGISEPVARRTLQRAHQKVHLLLETKGEHVA